MSKGIETINDSIAASLILQGLAKKQGLKAMSKSLFGSKNYAYDIIVDKIHSYRSDGEYIFFTYHAVKAGKSKSPARIFSEVVLKDVVNKVLNEVGGGVSGAYAMGDTMSGAWSTVSGKQQKKAVADMYGAAKSMGGQMQLNQAKKMGGNVYKEVLKYGLTSNVRSSGVVGFEQVSYAGARGIHMALRGWSKGASWIDRLCGEINSGTRTDLKKMGGEIVIDYMYNPANGVMW